MLKFSKSVQVASSAFLEKLDFDRSRCERTHFSLRQKTHFVVRISCTFFIIKTESGQKDNLTRKKRYIFFVRPHHRFVHPVKKGTQLFYTLSYEQEQLSCPIQVFLLLRPLWTGSKSLMPFTNLAHQ